MLRFAKMFWEPGKSLKKESMETLLEPRKVTRNSCLGRWDGTLQYMMILIIYIYIYFFF